MTVFHGNSHDEYWDDAAADFAAVEPRTGAESDKALETTLGVFSAQGLEVRAVVGEDRADRAIIRHVLEHGIDLVVVGRRSRRRGDSRILGSVSRSLVHHCPCPVWVVKEGCAALPTAIAVGVDLLPVGDRAIEAAVMLARETGAALHLVHAFQLSMSVQMRGDAAASEYDHETAAAAREHIEKVIAGVGGFDGTKCHIGRTTPAKAILEVERRFEIDLAVLGTVSRGGLPGLILGNTAERLIDRLACSLLAVKPPDFVCALAE